MGATDRYNGYFTCPACGKETKIRKGKKTCGSNACRMKLWLDKENGSRRDGIIKRHLDAMNTELRILGLEEFSK